MLSAAAFEEISLHPLEDVELSFRTMLAGGFLLIALGIGMAVWRAFRAVAIERIIGTAVVTTFIFLSASLNGLTMLSLAVVAMFIGLAIDNMRIDRMLHTQPTE